MRTSVAPSSRERSGRLLHQVRRSEDARTHAPGRGQKWEGASARDVDRHATQLTPASACIGIEAAARARDELFSGRNAASGSCVRLAGRE